MFGREQKAPEAAEAQQEQEVKKGPTLGERFVEGLKDAMVDIADKGVEMFNHGRDEAASVLFTGSAHVMYGWGRDKDQQDVGEIEAPKTPEVQQEQEQDRGRSM